MNINDIVKMLMSLLTSATTESKDSSKKAPSPSSPADNHGLPYFKLEGNYYIWPKGYIGKISEHFSTREMTCHCHYPDCKEQRISKDLIDKLENIRIDVKQPLIVTSAFRCQKYQAYLRAAGINTVVAQLSQHELGNAADIEPKDGKMDGFEEICAKQFDSIGLAKTFLHCDLRKGKRRWNY